jgi:hypothetical protein
VASTTHKTYSAQSTALSTEFNSLANGSYTAASATIDNTTALDLFMDLQLNVTFGTAPSAGGTVDVYLLPSQDGTTFADGGGSTAPQAQLWIASFELRAVTTAQVLMARDIPIPGLKFKLTAKNASGQAFPASGSTIKYVTHSLQTV